MIELLDYIQVNQKFVLLVFLIFVGGLTMVISSFGKN
jgi:hypothetical protein